VSDNSDIEWTDATWNPVRGCTKVSPGCKHCYAETFAERWRGVAGHPYEQGFDPRLVPHKLGDPLRWREPRRVFVNSMSDLFMDFVPNEYIAACFGVMAKGSRHTYQILTKRAERLPQWFAWMDSLAPAESAKWVETVADAERACGEVVGTRGAALAPGQALAVHHAAIAAFDKYGIDSRASRSVVGSFWPHWPLPNVHLGVSVEDRKYGLPRIEHLRRVPAAVRFLSIEPLLEDLGAIDLSGIGWVIVGGESGPGAREMDPAWVRSIRDQCLDAGVPFFFKQWGGVRKKLAGRLLDGRTWDEVPR